MVVDLCKYYLSQDKVRTRGWARKMAFAMDTWRRVKRHRTPADKVLDDDKDKVWSKDKHCASSCTSARVELIDGVSSSDGGGDDDWSRGRGV